MIDKEQLTIEDSLRLYGAVYILSGEVIHPANIIVEPDGTVVLRQEPECSQS